VSSMDRVYYSANRPCLQHLIHGVLLHKGWNSTLSSTTLLFLPHLSPFTWIEHGYRALCLMTFPDILQHLNILKTSTSIRLAQLMSLFISVWLTGTGIVHLLENSGYLPDFSDPKPFSYWNAVYFLMVTMSSVGYGDITCMTEVG